MHTTTEISRSDWPRIGFRDRTMGDAGGTWYACYTRARHEKRVAQVLRDREFEGYLPVLCRERRWNDRTKRVDFPLYPGYVFVRTSQSRMYEVVSIPSVVTVVTNNGVPMPIREGEIENIRRFVTSLGRTGEMAEPVPMLARGQRVLVTSGPFEGVQGVVVEDRGQARVLVGVEALGQGFAINVPTGQLRAMGGG